MLTVSGLAVHRKGTPLVANASLTLHRGEVVALVGPNGAGKSSVLVALALGEGTRGEGSGSLQTLDGGRVALVPDASDDLFTRDTVEGELRAAERRLARRKNGKHPAPGIAAAHLARLRGDATMPLGREHPRDLSAGERRILAIALQTLDNPQVLLIDEPTRGLDPAARTAVAAALRAAADSGAAVLIATHDLDFAHGLGARILPMRDGVAPALAPVGESEPPLPLPLPHRPAMAGPKPRVTETDSQGLKRRRRLRMPRGVELAVLAAANLLALAAFCWPLLAAALPQDAAAALPYAALAIAPLAAVAIAVSMDGSVRSAHTVALLGVLAAVGSAVRVASTGVGGVEAVFILLILAGRAFGAQFRHAPRRHHHCRLQRPVGWHRALDAVPDLRLRVGGRRGRPAPPPGPRPGRTVDAGRLRHRGVLPVRAADQPVVLAVRGGRRHRHLLRAGRAAGHEPQQLPAVHPVDVDGGMGHPACRHHHHRHRRGGAGNPRRTPAGEAGLQHGFWTRRAGRAGPTRPCREPAAPQGLRSIRSAISGLVPRAWLMVGWSFFLPPAVPVRTGHFCGRVFTGICRARKPALPEECSS